MGIFAAESYMGGCRYYLGAAARAKFKFVQMDMPSSDPDFCMERKEISTKNVLPITMSKLAKPHTNKVAKISLEGLLKLNKLLNPSLKYISYLYIISNN